MIARPLVSVCLPVRDGGPYLEAALSSVLSQTERDLEVVVVDNASTDGTPETLARFDDPRLRPLRAREPLHIAEAHNLAARSARGELLAFMGADDVAAPERIERQVRAFAQEPALGMCSSWARMIDAKGRVLGVLRYPTEDADLRRVRLRYHAFVLPALAIRRSLFDELGGFDRRYEGAMDYDLTLRATERARVRNLPFELVDWRFHDASGSVRGFRSQQLGSLRARWAALRRGSVPLSEAFWLLKPVVYSALPRAVVRRIVTPYMLAVHGRRVT